MRSATFTKLAVLLLTSVTMLPSSAAVVCHPGYCNAGTECHECPAGRFSNNSACDPKGECDPCTRGHYCRHSQTPIPTPCDLGHFCPSMHLSVPIPCTEG